MNEDLDIRKRKAFGAFLRDKRISLKFSVRKASRLINIPFGVYASIERGEKVKIRMSMLSAAANLYSVPVDELCAMCERVPQDVFYKIIRNPELLAIVRAYEN